MSYSLPAPEQWLRYMPAALHQRQELRLVENAWEHLSLLSSLSLLSAKSSSGGDLVQARRDFAALSAELMHGLAAEALRNRVEDLTARAQVCIDVLVRNLFERTADIGFFATDVGVAAYLAAPLAQHRAHIEARLREYASKYTVYGNIFLFDPQGRLAASLHPATAVGGTCQADADHAFLHAVLDSDAAYVEHHAVHGFSGHAAPTLVYAQRVVHEHVVLGVLCLEFKLADEMPAIFGSIQGDMVLEQGADVVLGLVDAAGRVLVSSDPLQLPADWTLPQAAAAGVQTLRHAGRRYLMVVRDTQGFQGYGGPGWRSVALQPLDLAFEEAAQEERSSLMDELAGQADLLSQELRDIPRRSMAIQAALERSVWNGLLELNQIGDGAEIAPRELQFAKTLLSEIGSTARKTAQAFSGALQDLYSVVVRSLLRDAQSRAVLAMQILDRNLYERANDCRWWALAPQFAATLQAGVPGCAQATQVLRDIHALYTVYSCLVLFDRQGRVLAVSRPDQAHHVGDTLDEPWVQACLHLHSSQDYVASDYLPSRFYDQGPTFVYAAAVRDLAHGQGPVLGGIAVVWAAASQLQSILDDCAVGADARDALAFVDRQDQVVRVSGAAVLAGGEAVEACRTGGRMVNVEGRLYGVGVARGQGYREFRAQDGYDHGVSCLVLRHLCERRAVVAPVPALAAGPGGARQEGTHVQMASFLQGSHWLALVSGQVVSAMPDAAVLNAGGARPPFLGLAQIDGRVCSVVDLRSVIASPGETASVSRAADPRRQLVVVRITLDDGRQREFALRVDALGAMLELDPRHIQPLGMRDGGAHVPLVDAVALVPTVAGESRMLCRISTQWLRQCAMGALGDMAAQDLEALLGGA